MCFWREWRSYLGTSACVMMGLSRGAAATTTTMSGKHFVSCSRGILTGQRHNLKCSQFRQSTQTWSSETRRQVLARTIKEDFRGIFQLSTSGKAAGALFHQYSLDHQWILQWILAFHDISQVFPDESGETWELLESTLCLWCWFSP